MSILAHGLRAAAGNASGGAGFIGYIGYTANTVPDNTTTITVDLPSGAQEGDLLLIAISADEWNSFVPTSYSGNGLTVYSAFEPSSACLCAMYKTLSSSEPSSYTINFATTVLTPVIHAMLFRGYSFNAGDSTAINRATSTSASFNNTGSGVAIDDITVALAAFDDDPSLGEPTPSTGYTKIGFDAATLTSGFSSTLFTQYRVATSSGVQTTSPISPSGFADSYTGIVVVLSFD